MRPHLALFVAGLALLLVPVGLAGVAQALALEGMQPSSRQTRCGSPFLPGGFADRLAAALDVPYQERMP